MYLRIMEKNMQRGLGFKDSTPIIEKPMENMWEMELKRLSIGMIYRRCIRHYIGCEDVTVRKENQIWKNSQNNGMETEVMLLVCTFSPSP